MDKGKLRQIKPPHLDPFLVAISLDDPVDVDAGDVDVLCCKCAHIYNLLHLTTEHRLDEGKRDKDLMFLCNAAQETTDRQNC